MRGSRPLSASLGVLSTGSLAPIGLALGLAAGCGDDRGPLPPPTQFFCAGAAAGVIGERGAEIAAEDRALGAYILTQPATTVPTAPLSVAKADDIVPAGYVALGPAVAFGAEGSWSDRSFQLALPYDARKLPQGAEPRHVQIVARRAGQDASFFPAVSNRMLEDATPATARASFCAGELTTYQVVARADAGTPVTERFAWNAIIGISMGGFAANTIGLRHPDKFDIIANIGGDPGPSMIYALDMIQKYLFGGFCTAEDEAAGRGAVGELCPRASTLQDQYEITADFEHMITQEGDGVGLTLRRNLYMKASRDLARALSNPALYNPDSPYAPPGVPMSYFETDAATRCSSPIVLDDFYDREFNPAGTHPVITFCDGGDAPGRNAVFDPNVPQTNPAEVLLAVDLNANGRRDAGEPVVTNAAEPFRDVGTDGVASKDEPGYDAATNPDPAKDDYHYLRNPRGTENNLEHEAGEPYEDVGLDGVAGTCQHGQPPPAGVEGCYDVGEGNGRWDLSPNVARWYQSDIMVRMRAMTEAQRGHLAFWFDAGIRDFLNNSVSVNQGVGQLMANYELPFGVFDSFPVLTGVSSESAYDFTEIDWTRMPRNLYVRYGNPDATAAEIERGDGRHVGTAVQIINRATTAFAWLDKRWPGGDRSDTLEGGTIIDDLAYTSPTTGRVSPYGLFLPPGYNDPANAGVRYPVVYFLHGYGQAPEDLVDLSSVFALYMIAERPLAVRFQKFIIVYVDGRCRPQRDGVPVDPTGDRCEGGTFYMDAPLGGLAQMETHLLELMDHIDASYRTKQPSDAELVR